MTDPSVEETLLEYLASYRGIDRGDLDEQLVGGVPVDSIELVTLATFAEETYGISVGDEELWSVALLSVPDLAGLVRSKLVGSSSEEQSR